MRKNKLIPVTEWNNHHTWPPIGGLRHLIYNSSSNGFTTAFKRVGRRVLIDENEFFACVERQNKRISSKFSQKLFKIIPIILHALIT